VNADNDFFSTKNDEGASDAVHRTREVRDRVGRWPSPTIVVGLPKAGTVSLAKFFRCGGIEKVVHHRCNHRACGAIIQRNLASGKNPFANTGRQDVYTQIDVELNVAKGLPCFFPQIEALLEIHRAHPNSTFLLNTRNVDNWIRSLRGWGRMDQRLVMCNISGLPQGRGESDEELRKFFWDHVQRIRKFVDKFPSHRLVHVKIDSPEAAKTLQDAFGIDAKCWEHHNRNAG
jgi:hypothetical protein